MYKLEITGVVKSDRVNQLLAYWERRRQGRAMPTKRDIDPAELKPLLPYMMIAEIHVDPIRVRYRLVGTEAVRMAREDYTGRWLTEIAWGTEEVACYTKQFAALVEARRPLLGTGHLVSEDGKVRIFEWGKFPLSDDGEHVTHCVGIEDMIPIRAMQPVRAPARR